MRLFLAALVLIIGAASAEAQWLDRKTPGVPRTPDGVHTGINGGNTRTCEVTLSGSDLIATIVGPNVEGGLGAAGLDDGAPRPLVPQSQTVFEGLGLGYQFIVDGTGRATDLVVIHISGPYKYSRVK